VESKGKFLYVANQGNNTQGTNAESGIAGYVITPLPRTSSASSPVNRSAGSGPQCLVEDPSDQFIYSADFNDSSVTGRVVDPNSGRAEQSARVPQLSAGRAGRPGAWWMGVPARTIARLLFEWPWSGSPAGFGPLQVSPARMFRSLQKNVAECRARFSHPRLGFDSKPDFFGPSKFRPADERCA
jgi:hypothetical protein